jgi:glycosyltransferase involved in cell wall biosynthesis
LPGRYEPKELLAWYHCASGFILPSYYEPFGAVINEALIFGLPVFCSQFAGASFLLNSGEDFLFNPNHMDESRVALQKFVALIPKKNIVSETLSTSRMRIDYHQISEGWKKRMYDQDI